MTNEIKRDWIYSQSSEEVWEYLTKAELLEKWLMPNNFVLQPGYEFEFKTNPILGLGLDGTFYCKILEIIPKQKLVYSWQGGLSKSAPTLETVVTWTLEAMEKGTKLTLVHTGFKEDNNSIRLAMYDGWNEHIQKMIINLKSS